MLIILTWRRVFIDRLLSFATLHFELISQFGHSASIWLFEDRVNSGIGIEFKAWRKTFATNGWRFWSNIWNESLLAFWRIAAQAIPTNWVIPTLQRMISQSWWCDRIFVTNPAFCSYEWQIERTIYKKSFSYLNIRHIMSTPQYLR